MAAKYALIMAGGVGSRFWPMSTASYPKQFHDFLGAGRSLLQQTFDRMAAFIAPENILILTNERYASLVLEQLPAVTQDQLVLEPCMRNTAPCILYAAMKIAKKDPEAQLLVAPSDHWIEDQTAFAADVEKCFKASETPGVLCTLGITPSFPNTGFGYIETGVSDSGAVSPDGLLKVVQFREKPDYKTAQSFIAAGNFSWNAGIFIWSVPTILNAFEEFEPELFDLFKLGEAYYNTAREVDFITKQYPLAANISIDYAILERASDIYMCPASFDWNDLGTWGALYDKLPKDAFQNAVAHTQLLASNARGNMVMAPAHKKVVIEGLEDFIVVDQEGILMIYPRAKEQDIKALVAQVKDTFGPEYT